MGERPGEDLPSFSGNTTATGQGPVRQLGKYELVRFLGRGGMGEVWLARDTIADITVALKMLPPELRYSEDAQDQVRASYRRVHDLDHPAIASVKDLVLDPHAGYFLVMKYFEGVTLSRYRRNYVGQHGAFSLQETLNVLSPVAKALDHAHSLKIVHRDIKPGNILVSADGAQVRVIDFQLASEVRATVSQHTTVVVNSAGTYLYMAPEQFRGQRASPATDLYSLAMVAYELLAGDLPWEQHGWEAWKGLVTDATVPFPRIDHLSEAVQKVLERGLSRNVADRPTSCWKFLVALANATKSPVTSHGPTPPPDEISKTIGTPQGSVRAVIAADAIPGTISAPSMGKEFVSKSTGMQLTLIPAGEFLMGSSGADIKAALAADATMNEGAFYAEKPQHRVRITKPFYLGKFAVTQAEYQKVVGRNPSSFSPAGYGKLAVSDQKADRFPVESVTWFDAVAFCNALSAADGLSPYYEMARVEGFAASPIYAAKVSVIGGPGYRLPTEAEWEYSCRSGTTSPYHFGCVLNGDKANVNGNVPFGTKTRGTYLERSTSVDDAHYPVNGFGLAQMHGNVCEWCWDGYDRKAYAERGGLTTDPVIDWPVTERVIRGGSWDKDAKDTRSACRGGVAPSYTFNFIGFRLARTP